MKGSTMVVCSCLYEPEIPAEGVPGRDFLFPFPPPRFFFLFEYVCDFVITHSLMRIPRNTHGV